MESMNTFSPVNHINVAFRNNTPFNFNAFANIAASPSPNYANNVARSASFHSAHLVHCHFNSRSSFCNVSIKDNWPIKERKEREKLPLLPYMSRIPSSSILRRRMSSMFVSEINYSFII